MSSNKQNRDDDNSVSIAQSRKTGQETYGSRAPGHIVGDNVAKKTGKGLDVDIHPLLRASNTSISNTQNTGSKAKKRKWFDPTRYNPYIDDAPSFASHRPKPLKFIKHGEYVQKGQKLREKLKEEEGERKRYEELERKGLVPDVSLNEKSYQPPYPPLMEWWDRPYLRDNNYSRLDDETRWVLDNEEMPITSYVQHPVLLYPIWLDPNGVNTTTPMFLTKKERKRMRKNDRQIRHKEMQDRIKLGLEPPPEPKVKLSNLMNVLTNEAIRDPTAVENRVKQQVEERLKKHLADNEARKLTKEEKHAKIYAKQEQDLAKGIFTTVYKVKSLDNPQHSFKVDVNAKQDNLFGICLKNPEFNLIVVEGGEKSINHYKKLLMNRIKWSEGTSREDKGDDSTELASSGTESIYKYNDNGNECVIIWEGRLPRLNFQKWSFMYSRNDEEAINVLRKFGLENYWRLAKSR
ncbi:PRP3 [Candida theae]|uniref:PRP3 n=1 Tax=Candida theae TaxID=1198502 RepID=A0AAD5BDZ2_9ASCO|nr:PRP3 [Candida theae]KAI5957643.1 PRP3 [Candida theae]